MATQKQLKILFGRKSHGRQDFQKEKQQQQQNRVFFGVIFYVYTNVDACGADGPLLARSLRVRSRDYQMFSDV